jgi:hypothetical protein
MGVTKIKKKEKKKKEDRKANSIAIFSLNT